MQPALIETRDVATIDSVVRSESVYPFVSDDSCPKAENFSVSGVVSDPANTFYAVMNGARLCGVFAFLDGELHTCLLPSCRGRDAVTAGKMAIEKFQREHGRGVRSFAWAEEPRSVWYAKAIGLKKMGEPSLWRSTRGGKPATRIEFQKEVA